MKNNSILEIAASRWQDGNGWLYQDCIVSQEKTENTDLDGVFHELYLNGWFSSKALEEGTDEQYTVRLLNKGGNVIEEKTAWLSELLEQEE